MPFWGKKTGVFLMDQTAVGRITQLEAIKFIENDAFDFLKTHKGFLCEGDYPFRPPQIFKNGIIVWPPADIHPGAEIGSNVTIGRYTNICGGIKIGKNTRIQGFCFIPDSVEIGENVFIGPNVVFTNIKYPQVRSDQMKERDGLTKLEWGVSIGAGAVICPGVKIGKRALVGAGAVVTKDVKPDSVMVGCPAKELKR